MIDRVGIGLAFAALTCWMAPALAASPPTPPEWPWTQAEMDAYIAQVLADAETIPTAAEFYATQEDPTVLVQEFMLPDLNGDGLGDMVIPTANFGPADVRMGKVGVISGWFGDNGLLLDVTSDEAGDSFGIVALGIPDINGDLIDDLAVGAPTSNIGAQGGGRVDVFSGATGALILRIKGNEADGRLGLAIDSAGDCNGDGINDIVVGEPHTDAVRGRAFVFYGADGLGAGGAVLRSPADADLSLSDNLAGAQFGFSVAGAGDLNGDGTPDLAVGSPNRSMVDPESIDNGVLDRLGSVSMYSGLTGERILTVNGTVENSWLGRTTMGNVDVDGDGANDLLIAAPGFPDEAAVPAPTTPSTDGRIYVLTSSAIAQQAPGATIDVNQIGLQLVPPAGPQFQFGIQIAPSHDADGDGVRDILVTSMVPVEIQLADIPGEIDLAAAGLPADMPIYTMQMRSHIYSGAGGALIYSYDASAGSGVEIKIPYPGPVVVEQTSQATPIGDTTHDGVVNADDLAQTVGSVGQPATSSPMTDVNQNGVTDVVDVGVVINIIDVQEAEIDCRQLIENGLYNDVCECFKNEFPDLDLSSLSDPEAFDCAGGDDPGPPGVDDGGGCEQEQVLPTDAVDCLQYALDLAACEFGPDKAALDAEQNQINQDQSDAQVTFSNAQVAATNELQNAFNLAVTTANIVTTVSTQEMKNEFAAVTTASTLGGVGGLVSGTGSIIVESNPVTGALLLLVGSGFLIHILVSTDNFSDAMITINHQMLDTVLGGPDAFTSRPVIDSNLMDQGHWDLMMAGAAAWATATAQWNNDMATARSAYDSAMASLNQQQDDLDQRREACQAAQDAREIELLTGCLDGFGL